MRQGQSSKRMRGRGRKTSNPMNRVYESNGPDVKVRGTANHVAEKYVAMAREAQVSGDPVGAENYLQHAEHYQRIVASAQQQTTQKQGLANANSAGNEVRRANGMDGETAVMQDAEIGEDEDQAASDETDGGGESGGTRRRQRARPEIAAEASDDEAEEDTGGEKVAGNGASKPARRKAKVVADSGDDAGDEADADGNRIADSADAAGSEAADSAA